MDIRRVIKHILLWFIFFIVNYLSFDIIYKDNAIVNIAGEISSSLHTILLFYIFGYYIFPKYLYRFKSTKLLLWLVILFYIVYIYNYLLFRKLQPYSDGYNSESISYVEHIWNNYLKTAGPFGCFISLRVAFWNYAISVFYATLLLAGKAIRDILLYQKKNARLELDKVKLERDNLLLEQTNLYLELDFLKAQINPHFLFNILNSIYVEIVDSNESAATRLAMLATLMRYGLYEATTSQVSINRELQYIENYLELEKIRHQGQAAIQLERQGNFEVYQIVPLLLISFVENAFKHGINKSKAGAFLTVQATMQDDKFLFAVENSVTDRMPKNVSCGIGLTNTRKRLDLLYPQQYTLDVYETENRFKVLLTLYLPKP